MIFTTVTQIGSKSRLVRIPLAALVRLGVAVPLLLAAVSWGSDGAESGPPPPTDTSIEETNSQAQLQLYLQLQEQLRLTQLTLEQNRQEAKAAAAQNVEALSNGLESIQQALSAQRAQDWAAIQKSNRLMLLVVGAFAGMGFLALLIMTGFQWRMSKCLADISAALSLALEPVPEAAVPTLAPAEQSNRRLLRTTEQHGHLTRELEPSPHPALERRERVHIPGESRLFPAPGDSARRRQFRALGMAVIVGLICAAGLALLMYIVTRRRLG